MEPTQAYYDLCVPFNPKTHEMNSILNGLYEMGFRTVAIDQTLHFLKDKVRRGIGDVFPPPLNLEPIRAKFSKRLRILQRLTVVYSEPLVLQYMTTSKNLPLYDLVAAQPKTDEALAHCCASFPVDIVTFDEVAGSKLLLNRRTVEKAVRRGLFFELKYGPILADDRLRKDMIKMSLNYLVRGRARNVIISSGARNSFQLRGPTDIAYMALIFGMNQDQGKEAINRACRRVFINAHVRRMGKTAMFVKGTGPVIFSDSSSSDEDDDESDEEGVSPAEHAEPPESDAKAKRKAKSDATPPIKKLRYDEG